MDVTCANMEAACHEFRTLFKSLPTNVLHISFTTIEPSSQSLKTISSQYHWHVSYWEENLNLRVASRMKSGISDWQKKDRPHQSFLLHHNVPYKTDVTQVLRNKVDILSIATKQPLGNYHQQQLLRAKSAVSFHANKLWRKHSVSALPLQSGNHCEPTQPLGIPLDQEHFQFADIILTRKELSTIKMLLSLKSPKEIAWCHQCSESAERKRIDIIKRKLGCQGKPKSHLFNALTQYGIAQTCWDSYTT
ncbi:hypothetical protein M9194_18935 [Vibrio sp. S4M6]|uniref:helix-turn-helix transcriptional regulator n=1 Tax=Vibrio sinus TaxID=2946865 RepID=UPI00202A0F50|nr:hypothetical protein [Vibrio sinus]MCL9783506.1 hypothetical protein [Vibrio sinus]